MDRRKEKILSYFNGDISYKEIEELLSDKELLEFYNEQKILKEAFSSMPYKTLPENLYRELIFIPEKEEKTVFEVVFERIKEAISVFLRKEAVFALSLLLLIVITFVPKKRMDTEYIKFKLKDEVKSFIDKGEYAKDIVAYNIKSRKLVLNNIMAKIERGGRNER